MQRRGFLKNGLGAAGAALLGRSGAAWADAGVCETPSFSTGSPRWQAAYDKALGVLQGNVQRLPRYPEPVLIEGAEYAGIWMECGPLEALVYRRFRPDVARNSHRVFFALQRADGQLPANNKRSETGFGQIQMVVPIAATAWELARDTGDEALLSTAYTACTRWDAWLARYRNTRGTGLVEGFCTYDTGMDRSPRWAGMPSQCPQKDAKLCPPMAGLPRLCPDLSATVYGARIALAAMASALGRQSEADEWKARAEGMRKLIMERLYDAEDGAFYDLDAQNRFVKVRCDILSRVCGEHVVSQEVFEHMWRLQLGKTAAFWAPYPLPSVALDDPAFVRPIPRNSWGGASQALTALRAGRWMEHYGRAAEFAHMMERWCGALERDPSFLQQLDPVTGEFTQAGSPKYSPACLVFYDYTWRLAGIREQEEQVEWSVRPDLEFARDARFRLPTRHGPLEMRYTRDWVELKAAGRDVARVRGVGRLCTDGKGKPLYVLGVRSGLSSGAEAMVIRVPGEPDRHVTVRPNERVQLDR